MIELARTGTAVERSPEAGGGEKNRKPEKNKVSSPAVDGRASLIVSISPRAQVKAIN